jgi:hypothetical protein
LLLKETQVLIGFSTQVLLVICQVQCFHLALHHLFSSITLGDGSFIPIYGVGHAQLQSTTKPLLLRGVLVASTLIKTLIFVGHFTHDNLAFVKFDPFGLSVKDGPTKAEIAHFNSLGDLYSLNGAPAASQPSSMVASVDLWHNRLGHPHTPILSCLLSEFATPCN